MSKTILALLAALAILLLCACGAAALAHSCPDFRSLSRSHVNARSYTLANAAR